MRHGVAVGQPFVYRGTEHAELRGQHGIILEVLSPRLLLTTFDLPDGRRPVVKVPPEDVAVSEADAVRFLRPELDPDRRVRCSRCEARGALGPLLAEGGQRSWDAWLAAPESPPPEWALLTWGAPGVAGEWHERVDLRQRLARRPVTWDCGRHGPAPRSS